MLNVTKSFESGKATYVLEGRLDTFTAPELSKDHKDALDGITELIFDFKDLEFITSAGLRTLLAAQKTMDSKQGIMRVLNANDDIMQVFEATGFAAILTFE